MASNEETRAADDLIESWGFNRAYEIKKAEGWMSSNKQQAREACMEAMTQAWNAYANTEGQAVNACLKAEFQAMKAYIEATSTAFNVYVRDKDPTAFKAYVEARAPAWVTYEKTEAAARKVCMGAWVSALNIFEEDLMVTRKALEEAMTAARETYKKAVAPAWKACREATAKVREEEDEEAGRRG